MSKVPDITHPEMVATLAKTGYDILMSITPESCHNLHMAVGICGEVGELAECYFDEEPLDHKIEEFGDIEFYMEGLSQGTGVRRPPIEAQSTRSTHQQLINELVCAAASLLDVVKKQAIYAQDLKRDVVETYMMEIDVALTRLRHREGLVLHDVLDNNMRKLAKRYENFQYSDSAAKARADKQ